MKKQGEKEVSNWWWIAPVFFTIFGGLIAWYVNREKNSKKAWQMLGLGIIMLIPSGVYALYDSQKDPTAKFETSNITFADPIYEDGIDAGDEVKVSAKVTNVGDKSGTENVKLKMGEKIVDSKKINLENGKSKEITFTVQVDEVGTKNVQIGETSENLKVSEPDPAEFEVSNLSVSPTETEPEETVEVSVKVANNGDLSGEYKAELSLDGNIVRNENISVEGKSSTHASFSISKSSEGTYDLKIENLSDQFTVDEPPTTSASADVTNGIEPLTVEFTGTGTDLSGSIESYSWDFGDGGTSNEQNPTHTFDTNGAYYAELTVTDDEGSTATDTINISVSDQPEWVHIKTYVAATEYYYNNWSLTLPDNPDKEYILSSYYSYDDVFTEDFNIQGNKFKIEYSGGGDPDFGSGGIYTYPEGTDINHVGLGIVSGSLSEGSYTVEEGSGTYYIVFGGEYIDYYTAKVYDWR